MDDERRVSKMDTHLEDLLQGIFLVFVGKSQACDMAII